MKQKGFTLIELLVVVAIIGLLASIILASLNSSRNKASDAAIKQQLSDMRTASILVYDNTSSYDTVCDANTDPGKLFRAAWNLGQKDGNEGMCMSSGTTRFNTINSVLTSNPKTATPEAWAAVIHLQSGQYFCVDYTGNASTAATRNIGGTSDVDC